MVDQKRILLLEPYYSGSHRNWATGLRDHSRYRIEILHLPGVHWKWRMHGAAVTMAGQYKKLPWRPELILSSSMLDLNVFLGLTRKTTSGIPVVHYMHENQIMYPWSPHDEDVSKGRDNHYGFIQYTSMLCAQEIWFNSYYHKNGLINALYAFLDQFPDHNNVNTIKFISKKAKVIYPGFSFISPDINKTAQNIDLPTILWNHRWEYDKGPHEFYELLWKIKKLGIAFNLIVLGKQSTTYPPVFDSIRNEFRNEIIYFGFADNSQKYYELLMSADILPVTSRQDFFGISTVEAISAGVTPVLPDRLAYSEHLTKELKSKYIYREGKLLQKVLEFIHNRTVNEDLVRHVSRYKWERMIKIYDERFDYLIRDRC